MTFAQQCIAKMRTQESSPARYQYSHRPVYSLSFTADAAADRGKSHKKLAL